MAPIIKLEASFTAVGDALKVSYTVTNNRARPAWLLDQLWQYTPTGDLIQDPYGAYISLGVDGLLEIGRFLHPLPQAMLVEQRMVPYARQLAGLATLTETLDLSLPLTEYNPYYDDPPPEEELAKETTAARFHLSWVPALHGMTARAAPLAGATLLDAPSFMPEVRTVKTDSVALKVAARRRTDDFERFA